MRRWGAREVLDVLFCLPPNTVLSYDEQQSRRHQGHFDFVRAAAVLGGDGGRREGPENRRSYWRIVVRRNCRNSVCSRRGFCPLYCVSSQQYFQLHVLTELLFVLRGGGSRRNELRCNFTAVFFSFRYLPSCFLFGGEDLGKIS